VFKILQFRKNDSYLAKFALDQQLPAIHKNDVLEKHLAIF